MADAQLSMADDVKAALLRTDDSFRQLVTEHQALDERIRHLAHRSFPTDQEQLEAVDLKKKKLALKDRIESIMRRMNRERLADGG